MNKKKRRASQRISRWTSSEGYRTKEQSPDNRRKYLFLMFERALRSTVILNWNFAQAITRLAIAIVSKAGSLVVFIGFPSHCGNGTWQFARMPPPVDDFIQAERRMRWKHVTRKNNMLIILLLFPIWKVLYSNRESGEQWDRRTAAHLWCKCFSTL